MTVSRPFEISLNIPVRTYDIDFAGIVSNIVYVRWLEDLRLAMLEAHMPLDEQMRQGMGPILVSTHIEYKRPVRLFDPLIGKMWVSELGMSRFQLKAEFSVKEEVTTLAEQITVFINMATFRPVGVPDHIRASYEAATREAP